MGIDTVRLGGKHFEAIAKTGQRVKRGELLLRFDIEKIVQAGFDITTPMVICNSEEFDSIVPTQSERASLGEQLLRADRR